MNLIHSIKRLLKRKSVANTPTCIFPNVSPDVLANLANIPVLNIDEVHDPEDECELDYGCPV